MRNKVLVCCLAAVLLGTVACGASTTTNTTNTKPAATPASTVATQAASPASSAADSSATANQDFTLINQTGVEIDKVFISPHSSNDWEEDILGRDTLPSGESVDIKFHRAEKAPVWDLRIEDKQGHSIEWENLNLLEINKLTLDYKDGKATAKID
jgi:hypothetical protein